MTTLSFVSNRTYDSALRILQENDFYECENCNEMCHCDETRTVDDQTICDGCAENANYCEGYEEYTFDDVTNIEGNYYCDRWRDENAWQDGDGEWWLDSTDRVEYEDTNESWTLEYAQENGYYDSDNDVWYSEQPETADNSGFVNDDEGSDVPVRPASADYTHGAGMSGYHGDSIRQSWIVPSGAIGVEIESYCNGNRDHMSNEVRATFKCAAERDGSLDDRHGVEVITPPMLPSELSEQLPKIMQSMQSYGCEAWKKKGYGIHVNMDCRTWSDNTKATFCNQFNGVNADWLKKYAGRGDTDYTKLKPHDSENDIPTSKYSAAGVKSGGRCEVRIFRSTLRIESVMGYVSLCQDALRYSTETLTTKPSHFLQWLKHNASPTTRKHLEYKGIIQPMPVVSSGF